MHISTNSITLFLKKLFWLVLTISSFTLVASSVYTMIYGPKLNPLLELNIFQFISLSFSFVLLLFLYFIFSFVYSLFLSTPVLSNINIISEEVFIYSVILGHILATLFYYYNFIDLRTIYASI